MLLEYQDERVNEQFQMSDFTCPDQNIKLSTERLYRVIWVQNGVLDLVVDTVPIRVTGNQIIFFTPHNDVSIQSGDFQLISFAFNREFYCINDHDHEVSCYGHLFYGSSSAPIITLSEKECQSFNLLFKVLREEFEYKDHIQGEMLRVLLKRLLIKSARLINDLLVNPQIPDSQLDVIRQFNVLVEKHFKEKHQVKDYAELLFKSPKTLSNLFKQYNNLSPLQVINDRIALEAKRQLSHTNKTVEELAFELGYSDGAHFSKFFKKQVGLSPNVFKKSLVS